MARRRLAHVVRSLPPVVRAELVGFVAIAIVLIAIRAAESSYGFDPSEPDATATTHAARLLAIALLIASAVLAAAAPRHFERAADDRLLRALPIGTGELAVAHSGGLLAVALPLGIVGIGAFLPPLAHGEPAVTAAAVLSWAAWLWASAMTMSLVAAFSLSGRFGTEIGAWSGALARLLAVAAIGAAYFFARLVSTAVSPEHGSASLVVTAAIGAALGGLARWALTGVASISVVAADRARERWEIRTWRRARFGFRRAFPPLPRLFGGALGAWIRKDTALALRHRTARAQWMLALGLEVAAIAVALRAASTSWALGGLLLVGGAAAAGVAILMHWSEEQPGWRWGAPVSTATQWHARALPVLSVGLVGIVTLVCAAWLRAGGDVARPLALWTIVCGVSLVASANNLGAASPPRDPVGQNLYALGLFSATLVGAVFPVVGWAALAGFAAYTARSLTRDARP
jgi:hypothetical protein